MISFVNNNNIDKSILAQVLINKEFMEKCIMSSKILFESELKRVLFATKRVLESKNDLEGLEELYSINKGILDEYKKYNELLNVVFEFELDEKSLTIATMFRETFNKALEHEYNDENPISKERNRIIKEGSDKIDMVISDAIKVGYNYEFQFVNTLEEIRKKIGNSYTKIFIGNISSITQLFIRIITKLNTLEKRVEMTRFMEELVKRRRETDKILRIDIKEIKTLAIPKDISDVIEDTYYKVEQLNKLITKKEQNVFEIMNTLNLENLYESDFFENMFNKQAFDENVLYNKEIISVYDEFQLNKYKTLFDLYQKISDELNNAMRFSMNEIYNQSNIFKVLSCDVVQQFKVLNNVLETIDIPQIKNENHKNIISGIMESISIKSNALKEGNDEYIIVKKEDVVAYEKRLMDYIEEIEEKLEEYFLESVNKSTDSFAKAEMKYNKIVANIIELNEKYDISHLKHSILSEIITFDDIINYSLVKLENSNDDIVQSVYKALINVNKKLSLSLESSNIKIVIPKVKQKFDGNLNEVVSIKNQEGYNKGEIIQVYSKGFVYNDRVLIRANVSVAK